MFYLHNILCRSLYSILWVRIEGSIIIVTFCFVDVNLKMQGTYCRRQKVEASVVIVAALHSKQSQSVGWRRRRCQGGSEAGPFLREGAISPVEGKRWSRNKSCWTLLRASHHNFLKFFLVLFFILLLSDHWLYVLFGSFFLLSTPFLLFFFYIFFSFSFFSSSTSIRCPHRGKAKHLV